MESYQRENQNVIIFKDQPCAGSQRLMGWKSLLYPLSELKKCISSGYDAMSNKKTCVKICVIPVNNWAMDMISVILL